MYEKLIARPWWLLMAALVLNLLGCATSSPLPDPVPPRVVAPVEIPPPPAIGELPSLEQIWARYWQTYCKATAKLQQLTQIELPRSASCVTSGPG